MKKSSVVEWHTEFKDAQESMEDTERTGYLKTHRYNKNVEKLQNLFARQSQAVNLACYIKLLTILCKPVRTKRPELWSNKWFLNHDNALAELVLFMKDFMAKKSYC